MTNNGVRNSGVWNSDCLTKENHQTGALIARVRYFRDKGKLDELSLRRLIACKGTVYVAACESTGHSLRFNTLAAKYVSRRALEWMLDTQGMSIIDASAHWWSCQMRRINILRDDTGCGVA